MADAKAPTLMFPIDLEAAPKVLLAGREWAIPQLAILQASKVVPALMDLLPLIGKIQSAIEVSADGTVTTKDEAAMLRAMASITEETYATIVKAVFWSLKRGYPQLGQPEFDNMPVTLPELLNSLSVIMRQTGFIKPKASGEVSTGEAPAVEA